MIYFTLGLIAGISIVSVYLAGKLVSYRREMMLAKSSLTRMEKYNADLQNSINESQEEEDEEELVIKMA